MSSEPTLLDEKINGGEEVPQVDGGDENDEGDEEGQTQTTGW